jgi:uncharacterized protein YegP (UPF0339 family)
MTRARFEVVHTGPYKFHARFVAANGETVWVTESYRRRESAYEACTLITRGEAESLFGPIFEVDER